MADGSHLILGSEDNSAANRTSVTKTQGFFPVMDLFNDHGVGLLIIAGESVFHPGSPPSQGEALFRTAGRSKVSCIPVIVPDIARVERQSPAKMPFGQDPVAVVPHGDRSRQPMGIRQRTVQLERLRQQRFHPIEPLGGHPRPGPHVDVRETGICQRESRIPRNGLAEENRII